MPVRPVRCAIYTRQSVARPGRDATLASCALQRAACLGLIASNTHLRWTPVLDHFDDEGESGATTDRPALDRLVDAIADGRIDRVVVHRLDRLTRRVLDWARIQHAFRAHGVAISVVQGDLHGTNDAITQLRLNTLAIFAEFERDMIAERLRDARAARRARGLRVAGQLPLGYVADPATRQLVVAPEEAETVRRMFADAADGALPAAIAARANEVGTIDKNGRQVAGGRRPSSGSFAIRRTLVSSPTERGASMPPSYRASCSIAWPRRSKGAARDRRRRARRWRVRWIRFFCAASCSAWGADAG